MKLKTKVLYLVSFAAFLRSFAQVIYVPSLATMRSDLNTTTAMIGLTLSIYGLCLAFAQIAYGPIVDRFDSKRILLIGLVLYLFGNLSA
jgi:MFS family permease